MKLTLFTNFVLTFLMVQSAIAGYQAFSASVAWENRDGPDQRILTAVASRMAIPVIFQYAPFKRRLLMLKNGDIDMACGLLKRPEREDYIHYISPPYKKRSDTIFFVSPGKADRLKVYDDLKRMKIGVTRGSKYFIRFDEDTTLNKEIVHQATANFKKLMLGRIDTMIIDESTGIHLIDKMGIAGRVETALYRFSKNKFVYIGISKKSSLMKRLEEVEPLIRGMIQSGRIGQMIKDYYTGRNLPVPAY